MTDNSGSRTGKRGARGAMTLGAVRKGVEGNVTAATSRQPVKEPLLSKQQGGDDGEWGDDDWGDTSWGTTRPNNPPAYFQVSSGRAVPPRGAPPPGPPPPMARLSPRPGLRPAHQPQQPLGFGYSPLGRTSRLAAIGIRGRTCILALLAVVLIVGLSSSLSGGRRGSSREQQHLRAGDRSFPSDGPVATRGKVSEAAAGGGDGWGDDRDGGGEFSAYDMAKMEGADGNSHSGAGSIANALQEEMEHQQFAADAMGEIEDNENDLGDIWKVRDGGADVDAGAAGATGDAAPDVADSDEDTDGWKAALGGVDPKKVAWGTAQKTDEADKAPGDDAGVLPAADVIDVAEADADGAEEDADDEGAGVSDDGTVEEPAVPHHSGPDGKPPSLNTGSSIEAKSGGDGEVDPEDNEYGQEGEEGAAAAEEEEDEEEEGRGEAPEEGGDAKTTAAADDGDDYPPPASVSSRTSPTTTLTTASNQPVSQGSAAPPGPPSGGAEDDEDDYAAAEAKDAAADDGESPTTADEDAAAGNRGWEGEDIAAGAEDGVEGDGSFADGEDVAVKLGDEALADEEEDEDYESLPDDEEGAAAAGAGKGGAGKSGKEELTGGRGWEGEDVAAAAYEENEEEGASRGGTSSSKVSSPAVDEDYHYSEEGKQTKGTKAAPKTPRSRASGTPSAKATDGPPRDANKPGAGAADVDGVDPSTTERIIEEHEAADSTKESDSGAFSAADEGGEGGPDAADKKGGTAAAAEEEEQEEEEEEPYATPGMWKDHGDGAEEEETERGGRSGGGGGGGSVPSKQKQGASTAGTGTATTASTKPKKSATSGSAGAASGEARGRRSGSAGGMLPGRGGEELDADKAAAAATPVAHSEKLETDAVEEAEEGETGSGDAPLAATHEDQEEAPQEEATSEASTGGGSDSNVSSPRRKKSKRAGSGSKKGDVLLRRRRVLAAGVRPEERRSQQQPRRINPHLQTPAGEGRKRWKRDPVPTGPEHRR